MALVYVGGATGQGTAGSFSVSLTGLTGGIGSAAQVGDLVLVIAGCPSFGGATNVAGVESVGYTEIANLYSDQTRDCDLSLSYKRLTTAETSVTCSGSGYANYAAGAAVHVWRGVDATTPLDVTPTTAVGPGRGITHPPIEPVTAGAEVVLAGMAAATSAFGGAVPPSGFGNRQFVSHDPGTAVGLGLASAPWSGSGEVDPGWWTGSGSSSGDSYAAVTLALRPAGAAAVYDRSATVSAVSGASASRSVSSNRSASVSAVSALSATRNTPKSRSALVVSSSSVQVMRTVHLFRSANVASVSNILAAPNGSLSRSASVIAISEVTATPIFGVIKWRFAYPDERRGGDVSGDARGGELFNTPRGGIIQRS